jgi:nitroreductase
VRWDRRGPPGVHHFAPLDFGLTELRRGDHRGALAAAAAETSIAAAPVALVVTGIPWRTGWKYGERGFRHLYWDAGTMLANVLAVEPSATLTVGFVDEHVAGLIGIDGVMEHALALVGFGQSEPSGHEDTGAHASVVEPLDLVVEAISRAPIEFPLVTAAHQDGYLADAAAVAKWRTAAGSLGMPTAVAVEPLPNPPAEPIETVILRRGSTRLMRRAVVRPELLTWGLGAAARALRGDFVGEGRTLLEHFVSVHDVEGFAPGAFRVRSEGLQRGRTGQHRDLTAHLCLDQPLGGDSAYTVFHAAHLDEVLGTLGSRGYRAAQLEAGIAAGRLALAAFALGYGATGLTFFDDAVSQFFGTRAACMLVTSVGVPDYQNAGGGGPGAPTELAGFDRLMERLSLQLQRGRF